ncbi:actin-bundling T4SS effector WalE1 family protein [Wolbachia endosymbiont of Oedothorax gibbosus]|uniref:actin-bundling T4SS effector WalE1 family protein n=1 Tax=Wolbachia endosymbiont of Oedothorax gibbosus TaxID=931100 RepID=UPI0020248814|nr:hypothetical protein [Wolbachia endosymbiont of Oedothorax gibbosus]
MLPNNETNSNVVEIQQLQQQNNSTPSSEDLLKQKIESLGKEIKSLQKQGRLDRGIFRLGAIGFISYLVATNWSAIASAFSTTGTATVAAGTAAVPIAGIVIGAVVGAIVLVGASYAMWKYRAQIKEGFKYAAEKTVDGAKYTTGKVKDASTYAAGKVRDGAVHVRDSVKEAVSSVGQATREGTSSALRAMGDGVQKFGRKMSNGGASMSSLDGIPYSIGNEGQTVVLKTEEKTRNFNSVKEMFIKEVLEDKAVNNSALTKEIFSKLGEKILEKAYSVDGQQSAKKDQLINQLKQQIDFVNKLDAKKLQNLLSKDDNSLYEIFSEYHDEVKRIVKECKTEHKLSNCIENLNRVAEKHGKSRKGSTQSIENSLSKSSSLNSIGTESTATVSDSDSQNFATVRRSNSSNILNASPKLTPVAPPKPPRSASLTNLNGQSSFSEDVLSDPIVEQNLDSLSNRTLTHSNSTDSGMGSGSSTLTRKQVLPLKEEFDRELEEKLAKRHASLDQPSAEPVNSRATATPGTV